MGIPMGGFFDGVDVMFKAATLAPPAAAQGVPTETLTPQEVVIPPVVAQTEVTYSAAPLVSSTSDPFAALSQAMKDGSSLVVTPYSILSSATRGLDVDLSFKGFEDVLEDPNDKPKMKKRVSNFEKEESA